MSSSAIPLTSTNDTQTIELPRFVREGGNSATSALSRVKNIIWTDQLSDPTEQGIQERQAIHELLTTETDLNPSLVETVESVRFLPPSLAGPNSILNITKLPDEDLFSQDEMLQRLLSKKKIFADLSHSPDAAAQAFLLGSLRDATPHLRINDTSLSQIIKEIPLLSDISIELVSGPDRSGGAYTKERMEELGEEIAGLLWNESFVQNGKKFAIYLPKHLLRLSEEDGSMTIFGITKSHFIKTATKNLHPSLACVDFEWSRAFDDQVSFSTMGGKDHRQMPSPSAAGSVQHDPVS